MKKSDLSFAEKLSAVVYFVEEHCYDIDEDHKDVFVRKEMTDEYWNGMLDFRSDWHNGWHNGDCICAPSTCTACLWGAITEIAGSLIPFLLMPYGSDWQTALKKWFAHHFYIGTPKLKSNKVDQLFDFDKHPEDKDFIDKSFEYLMELLDKEDLLCEIKEKNAKYNK